MRKVNYSSFSAELAHRLLSSQEGLALKPVPWVLDDTLDCAPLPEVGQWALLKSTLALLGQVDKKEEM